MRSRVTLFLCLAASLWAFHPLAGAKTNSSPALVIYPAPPQEQPSPDYEVFVNGQPVFCYTSFRFDTDSKKTIAGRPVSPVSFCSFDHQGTVEVEVRFLDGLRQAGLDTSRVVVRPLAHGIKPSNGVDFVNRVYGFRGYWPLPFLVWRQAL